MNVSRCPVGDHFHVACRGVDDKRNHDLVVEGSNPQEALEEVLSQLETDWVGSIEVFDDQTMAPSEMPLLDYWKD